MASPTYPNVHLSNLSALIQSFALVQTPGAPPASTAKRVVEGTAVLGALAGAGYGIYYLARRFL